MAIFVDTSGVFAAVDPSDHRHELAGRFWIDAVSRGEALVTTSYVVVESVALMQRRLGLNAARAFVQEAVPLMRVVVMDRGHYDRGVAVWLAAGRRQLSLVDCLSFEAMREHGIREVFAFDPDFGQEGFVVLPDGGS